MEVRTGHISLVYFPLPPWTPCLVCGSPQPQGLGLHNPCSILKSEQACESTGWIKTSPLLNTPRSPRPSGRCPFHPGLLTCLDHDPPPPLCFLYSGCRGLKGAKCHCFLSLKGLVHITSSDWSSVLQSPLPPPSSLPLILHRWVRCLPPGGAATGQVRVSCHRGLQLI